MINNKYLLIDISKIYLNLIIGFPTIYSPKE